MAATWVVTLKVTSVPAVAPEAMVALTVDCPAARVPPAVVQALAVECVRCVQSASASMVSACELPRGPTLKLYVFEAPSDHDCPRG